MVCSHRFIAPVNITHCNLSSSYDQLL
jgi:hypothetical protein